MSARGIGCGEFLRRAAYVCLMALGFCYGAWGVPWYVRHLTQLALVLCALLFAPKRGSAETLRRTGGLCLILARPFVLALAYSMLCWALDMRRAEYITRGVSTIFYCLLAIAAMGAAVYIFGAKAVDLTLAAMCAANISVAAYSLRLYGLDAFVQGFAQYAASFGTATSPAIKLLEVHDLTFAFGLMALYYLLFDARKGVRRWLRAGASLAFFLLGLKRIGLLGLLAACVIFGILRLVPPKRLRFAVLLLALGALAACAAYIWSISSGEFAALAARLGIDTGGRLRLWEALRGEYTLSPLFRGRGIGYVTRLISILTQGGVGVFGTHSFGGLHNDILTLYIELGFCGFALWVLDCWLGRFISADRLCGRGTALLLACETAYLFVTCATDNTAFYCYVNTIFALLPLAHCAARGD